MLKRIIAVANQKGGVGKTTTSINVAAGLALAGQKTLLIDCDPQSNCTSGVGVDKSKVRKNIYNIFFDQKIDNDNIICTSYENLNIIPSQTELVGIDIELIDMPEREFILKNALSDISEKYDYVVIDCPPALNLLTVNALAAADSVLIPVQCGYFALEGLTQLLTTVNMIKRNINKDLEVEGFLMTMVVKGEPLSQNIIADVKNHFPNKIFNAVIENDNTLSIASSYGKPIVHYDSRSIGANGYIEVAAEILQRYKDKNIDESKPRLRKLEEVGLRIG